MIEIPQKPLKKMTKITPKPKKKMIDKNPWNPNYDQNTPETKITPKPKRKWSIKTSETQIMTKISLNM